MAINNRDKQRTRVVFVPVATGGGSQEKIKVAATGLKFGYSSFSKVPQIFDFMDVTNYSNMFVHCGSLVTTPELDTSQVFDMTSMFLGCNSLTTVLPMDTSNVTTMQNMFQSCTQLTTIPSMNTSRVTDMQSMFAFSRALTSVPQMDTSKVTTMWYMFNGCSSLTTVPEMNTSLVTNMGSMFSYCSSLTDLGGFIGLKCNLNLSDCSNLTHNSLMNVINKTADVTASPKTLTLGSANLAKLTDEEKAVATNKGWTLA